MAPVENWLLLHRMNGLVDAIAAAADADADALWLEAEQLLESAGAEEDADVALPVLERSLADVRAVVEGWEAGTMPLSEWDKAVLKRALKAYRKRLKLVRLDDESSASRNPLSKGESSRILGVKPPEQYPPEVWDFLIKQGKLRDGGHGLLELATV